MKKRYRTALLAIATVAAFAISANAEDGSGQFRTIATGNVQPFASLPQIINPDTNLAEGHPEGLCADSQGNVYANSFEQPDMKGYVQNYIYKFSPQGNLLSTTPVKSLNPNAPVGVVPLGCTVSGNKFYLNDVYNGDEYLYTLPLTNNSVPSKIFHICGGFTGQPGPTCGINDNVVGPDGHVYITDNGAGLFGDFIGRIWALDPTSGNASIFLSSESGSTLETALAVLNIPAGQGGPSYVPNGSILPYSANGIVFSHDGSGLYWANMSTNVIWKQKVHGCESQGGCVASGDPVQFSNDPLHFIQGPDNIDFDELGNLWIASGQQQHVVALDRKGNVIGVFGGFQGFDPNGAPIGLLQPSGVIYSHGFIYIGNESSQSLLPSQYYVNWGAQKIFTVSKVPVAALFGEHDHDDDSPDHR